MSALNQQLSDVLAEQSARNAGVLAAMRAAGDAVLGAPGSASGSGTGGLLLPPVVMPGG
ncbi:hypothetical protein HaLaN_22501, partial [Haematococcus lacustris]